MSEAAENDKTKAAAKADADAVNKARTLMRSALADELGKAGPPWAPSAGTVKEHAAAGAAEPADALQRLADNKKAQKDAAFVLVVAGLVALFGGYAGGWKWTGFQTNGQVWDWLNLLLLPLVLATIPLWVQDREYIGKGRRIMYRAAIAAFTGFVIAGYLVPISWAGFPGMDLWNWIGLLVLPGALAISTALTSRDSGRTAACCPRTRRG